MSNDPKYPECEKLSASRPESLTLSTFIEWLESQGISLCTFDHAAYMGMGEYYRIRDTNEQLLARYFNIDLNKLEEERCAILEAQRKANKE